MIKKITPNWDGKIISIEVEVSGVELQLDVIVFCVVNSQDPNNIGRILEQYRRETSNKDVCFGEHRRLLEAFISRLSSPFKNLQPDCIVCFYPADENRRSLLQRFKNKLMENNEHADAIDFSSSFKKKDVTKSIKSDNLKKEDFELSIESDKPFQNILIIDDVIDEGKTIDIFLSLLADKRLLNNSSKVNVACIYNRPKKKEIDLSQIRKR